MVSMFFVISYGFTKQHNIIFIKVSAMGFEKANKVFSFLEDRVTNVQKLTDTQTHPHLYTYAKDFFFFKSDTKLHSGIKAPHTRADTWSFSCCQRGLAIELRCLEEPEEFTPPTFCLSHSYTQAAGSPEKWKLITLCYHKHNSYSYYHMQRCTCIKEHNELCRL